jgi:signal transduction histidine kinase
MPLQLVTLAISAMASFWLAATINLRTTVPGSRRFVFLMIAVAEWSIASMGHWLADSASAKIAWAQIQYVGIVSAPPLWWAFTSDYAGVAWARRRGIALASWAIPIVTLLLAVTNPLHRAIWTGMSLTPAGGAVYHHGWWFWIAASYNYLLLLGGSIVLARAVRRSPLYRLQSLALFAAVLIPWVANILYITGLSPIAGVDPTAPAFAISGVLIGWALFRNRLFDLVPVARDQLVESLSDAVVVLDGDRRVLDMNVAARRLSNKKSGWLGHRVDDVLPFLSDMALHDHPKNITLPVPVDEDERWYDLRVMRVGASAGRFVAWVALLRDVTEQRKAEAEHAAFEKRVHEQQKRESLSVLAGGLAHDFNNLLAGIIGNADLLAMQMSPVSQMGSSVGAILLGAQRAADIVSKMLAYAGERHGASEMVDLDGVVREMLDLLQASAARHCTLTYTGQPVTIFADPVQIRQVAMNLIINASEAVDEGVGVINVSVGTGTLTADAIAAMRSTDDVRLGTYAYIEVRDNGQGMDDLTRSKIFTPFFTTKPGGHGLGLAAVQGIVRSHRGALHIETAKDKGCCFRVWFPIEPTPAAEDRAPRSQQSSTFQLPKRTDGQALHEPSAEGTSAAPRDR